MPTASAVRRSPRVASSAKSSRRWRSRIFSWWASRAFHAGRAVSGNIPVIGLPFSARLVQGGALGGDHVHELVPGADERLRAVVLELAGEGVHIDAGSGEPGQHVLAVATIGGQDPTERSVNGEGLQGALGHRVHRERRGERPYIKDVGRAGILGARAGPQQALRAGAGVEDALPARGAEQGAVRLVRPLRDRDAELMRSASGTLSLTAASHRLMNTEATEPTS